ncbi:MAG: hypothetical protein MUF46_00110 [Desulfobacterales bacterium]|jgi:hypothetical protein|nr:hypothetical protein [Desulfobacterales bacterium]
MHITTSQMHHVIDCYCRRLRKNPESGTTSGDSVRKAMVPGGLAPEVSRRAAMSKISEQVLHTIAHAGEQAGALPPGPSAEKEPLGAARHGAAPDNSFTFNVIDAINRKQTSTLAAADAGTLIRRLGQLAETRRGGATESWT